MVIRPASLDWTFEACNAGACKSNTRPLHGEHFLTVNFTNEAKFLLPITTVVGGALLSERRFSVFKSSKFEVIRKTNGSVVHSESVALRFTGTAEVVQAGEAARTVGRSRAGGGTVRNSTNTLLDPRKKGSPLVSSVVTSTWTEYESLSLSSPTN